MGMVHALHEAHRVLKPDGILFDLRPATTNRQVGILCDGRWHALATIREFLDDGHAADAAVARVVREERFREVSEQQIDVRRYMETVADFRAWLEEAVARGKRPPQEPVVARVERAVAEQGEQPMIVVKGPLQINILQRVGRQ